MPRPSGAVFEVMNDFRQIPFLTTELVKERHREHVRFLRENGRRGGIVMTHFAPSLRSLPDGSREHEAAGYYASDLNALSSTFGLHSGFTATSTPHVTMQPGQRALSAILQATTERVMIPH